MAAADCTQACSVMGCASPAHCKGFCSKHYQRNRTHGSPEITYRGLRVEKPCGWCGKVMTLKPGIATRRECCSNTCAGKLRAKREGRQTHDGFYCAGCHVWSQRKIRGRDLGRYCGQACHRDLRTRIASERDALLRIRANNKEVPNRVSRQTIEERLTRACVECQRTFTQRTHWGKPEVCCPACKPARSARMREEWRRSPAGLSSKRAAKSRRRARIRGVEHEAIDPIKVFERDKWRCHICGCKTHKGKRGTCDPKAPELDHVVTLSEGGSHTWGNVACSCRACNASKGARSMGQLGLGLAA